MKDKFGRTKYSFTFKLSVFHDKCQFIHLFSNEYLKTRYFFLTDLVQTDFYVNSDFIILFQDFC